MNNRTKMASMICLACLLLAAGCGTVTVEKSPLVIRPLRDIAQGERFDSNDFHVTKPRAEEVGTILYNGRFDSEKLSHLDGSLIWRNVKKGEIITTRIFVPPEGLGREKIEKIIENSKKPKN